jgi:hypothetical protein
VCFRTAHRKIYWQVIQHDQANLLSLKEHNGIGGKGYGFATYNGHMTMARLVQGAHPPLPYGKVNWGEHSTYNSLCQ